MFQARARRGTAAVHVREGTVGAAGGRVVQDHHARLRESLSRAPGPGVAPQPLDQKLERLAQAGFGGSHELACVVGKSDPGVVVAARFDEGLARLLKQPVAVLLPGDEPVDVADRAKHGVGDDNSRLWRCQ